MRKNPLVLGPAMFAAGSLLRFLPGAATLLSALSALLAVGGFVVFVTGVARRSRRIRAWMKLSPFGVHVAILGGIGLLLGAIQAFGIAESEVWCWLHAAPVRRDLARDDPNAALDLAVHLRAEWDLGARRADAGRRRRIVRRIGELGNSERTLVGTLRQAVRTDPSDGVRQAAAVALARLMTPGDVLEAIADLPDLAPPSRALFVTALETRTGRKLGDDPGAWLRWFADTWAGAGDGEAFALAVEVCRSHPGREEIRAAGLARVRQGVGADRERLEALLGDDDAGLRAAAADALLALGRRDWTSMLVSALKVEEEELPAERMADALTALDPEGAPRALLSVRLTGRGEGGRAAAARRLGGGAPADDATAAFEVYRSSPPGPERRAVLEDLVRLAPESASARRHLAAVARDVTDNPFCRTAALRAVLEHGGDLLSLEDLVGLLEGDPDADFAQVVRFELRRRTERDGGRDPEVWRKILEQLK